MGKVKSVFVLFATCLLLCTLADYTLDVKIKELQDQIEMEMQASVFYQTYAHYFENSNQALHGFAKFFYDQSLEEKKHADKLMTYMNQRNVKPIKLSQVPDICKMGALQNSKMCKVVTGKEQTMGINPAREGIKDAVKLEKSVLKSLEEILNGCTDAQLNHFIEHEYLDEQMQSIKELSDLKTQLEKINNTFVGELLLDRWLLEGKKHTEL